MTEEKRHTIYSLVVRRDCEILQRVFYETAEQRAEAVREIWSKHTTGSLETSVHDVEHSTAVFLETLWAGRDPNWQWVPKPLTFGDLKPGEAFVFNPGTGNYVYVRTGNSALRIGGGILCQFGITTHVRRCKTQLPTTEEC